MLFDTHCHLDDPRFDPDRHEVIAALGAGGVALAVNAGADAKTSAMGRELAHRYPFLYFTAGIHPGEVGAAGPEDLAAVEALLGDEKAVALGEIGLDYHYDDNPPRSVQQAWFRCQLELALRLHKPVVIHSRDAAQDTMDILRPYRGRLRGELHCFSGSWEMAKAYLDMGFYLSFCGSVTFKNAAKLPEIATKMPLDRLLIETDSPYMAPVPFRGKRNDPRNVREVARRIAELRGLPYEELCRATLANGLRFFGIPAQQGR